MFCILCVLDLQEAAAHESFPSFQQRLVEPGQSAQNDPLRDNWFGTDKLQHVNVSAWLTVWGVTFLRQFEGYGENRAILVSGLVTLGIGVAKELYDYKIKKTFFSDKDLVADVFGIFIIALLAKGL